MSRIVILIFAANMKSANSDYDTCGDPRNANTVNIAAKSRKYHEYLRILANSREYFTHFLRKKIDKMVDFYNFCRNIFAKINIFSRKSTYSIFAIFAISATIREYLRISQVFARYIRSCEYLTIRGETRISRYLRHP